MGMVLKDAALIAVHLGVAAGGQAGQPGPNDDQRLLRHVLLSLEGLSP